MVRHFAYLPSLHLWTTVFTYSTLSRMSYAQLFTLSNYSFLKGASHPQELVERACELGYDALAITDECSLAGVVKAYLAAKSLSFKLIIGSTFTLSNGCRLIAIAPHRQAYAELSGFITLARWRMPKGEYEAHLEDLRFRLQTCFVIWLAEPGLENMDAIGRELSLSFKNRLWIGINHRLAGGEQQQFQHWQQLSKQYHIPLVACPQVVMHDKKRKPLHDVLCAIDQNTSVDKLGTQLQSNAEAYLKPLPDLIDLYAPELIVQTQVIADQCTFSMDELRYQYPLELVPKKFTPIGYLRHLVKKGEKERWPEGTPASVKTLLEKELGLIEELKYEYYFLTVHDIVRYARGQNILCQGRGSAANSVVCYCLRITEIRPGQINVLFERFISRERDEPPDIDVDFEHERREEVIQYIYQKYTRQRAALAATVITYRSRSAIRDVGKALGLEPTLIDYLAKSLAWWDRTGDLVKRIEAVGLKPQQKLLLQFFALVQQILGFPRHLSQHVGGFVITQDKISELVPMENASMPDRTVIQWDKEDLEAMNLLKVDVLALGMLTALHKALDHVHEYDPAIKNLEDIPREDKATYDMLSRGDSIGVFQVESRAQMSMLPRLKPACFYDLVVEIAIVRPGPIQGDMVHPYLRRRDGIDPVTYESPDIEHVLKPTLGVPIFQEQAIRLAMVAAGFSGGEADQLRRAMASWGKNGNLLQFEDKFIQGMLKNNYPLDFARRLFEQIKGFGGYGFPESHSASFALLCYASSWLKYHHPAAFYCSLLNSQPMGFYSPSQLIQDARRHNIKILPLDINISDYDNKLEATGNDKSGSPVRGIRLGFSRIKSLDTAKAKIIGQARQNKPFTSLDDLAWRAGLSSADLQILASADALHSISGNRHQSRWQAAAVSPHSELLKDTLFDNAQLTTRAPSIEKDVTTDYQMTGLTLRAHPMALLRNEYPFNRCKKQSELEQVGNKRFVQVAGLVTGRQRPGTAKGTIFVTLEDETGNINVVVWKSTQELFRQELLTSQLLMVKGRLETKDSVIHVIAGRLYDYSDRLQNFNLKSRDFH